MFLRRKAIETLSDEDLLARVRDGQGPALAALWDRYAQLLFGVGMKYLRNTEHAQDEVVELFGTLTELLRKHPVQHFRPWVHRVMRNRCLMRLRRQHPERPMVEVDLVDDPTEEEEAVLHEATLQRLEAAIEQLKDGQRQCIRLFYLDRLSYQQVSERTGLPVDQVRSHLQNGRRNLRILLTNTGAFGA